MIDIGARIRAVREAKGLTQGHVASKLGVVQTTASVTEKSADLKHSVIRRISDVLEVSSAYLTGDHSSSLWKRRVLCAANHSESS